MTVRPEPPDDQRCQFLWEDGKQCRQYRQPDADHGFCKPHFAKIQRDLDQPVPPWPPGLADEILPDGTSLDSAAAVNAALTRLLRAALQGRIPARHAGSLTYLVQNILATIPGLNAEAEESITGLAEAMKLAFDQSSPNRPVSLSGGDKPRKTA